MGLWPTDFYMCATCCAPLPLFMRQPSQHRRILHRLQISEVLQFDLRVSVGQRALAKCFNNVFIGLLSSLCRCGDCGRLVAKTRAMTIKV